MARGRPVRAPSAVGESGWASRVARASEICTRGAGRRKSHFGARHRTSCWRIRSRECWRVERRKRRSSAWAHWKKTRGQVRKARLASMQRVMSAAQLATYLFALVVFAWVTSGDHSFGMMNEALAAARRAAVDNPAVPHEWAPTVPCKPSFMLIGGPKCGSTSLFQYLEAHPQVHHPAQKELCFLLGVQAQHETLPAGPAPDELAALSGRLCWQVARRPGCERTWILELGVGRARVHLQGGTPLKDT